MTYCFASGKMNYRTNSRTKKAIINHSHSLSAPDQAVVADAAQDADQGLSEGLASGPHDQPDGQDYAQDRNQEQSVGFRVEDPARNVPQLKIYRRVDGSSCSMHSWDCSMDIFVSNGFFDGTGMAQVYEVWYRDLIYGTRMNYA